MNKGNDMGRTVSTEWLGTLEACLVELVCRPDATNRLAADAAEALALACRFNLLALRCKLGDHAPEELRDEPVWPGSFFIDREHHAQQHRLGALLRQALENNASVDVLEGLAEEALHLLKQKFASRDMR